MLDSTLPTDDRLSEARLRAALGGRSFQYFPQLGSTSDVAREWAQLDAPDSALVIAEEQIAGRGRFDRRWQAPPGTALLFSVIVRLSPPLTPYANRLSIAGVLAVLHGVESSGTSGVTGITLKWPNDVLLNGRKLAGILAESEWDGDRLQVAILGIGINVRVPFDSRAADIHPTADAPADVPLAERAVSLEPTIGHPIDRIALLTAILDKLSFWTARLADPSLIAAWRSRLATLGTRVTVRQLIDPVGDPGGDRPAPPLISGQAIDVDTAGALLVQDDAGHIHRCVAGEVSLR